MHVTIIKADDAVYVDGRALPVDCSSLPVDFHALQWYGTWGEIEYVTDFSAYPAARRPNQMITDITPYQPLIDTWTKGAMPPARAITASSSSPINVIAD